jgi:hypothetical protein
MKWFLLFGLVTTVAKAQTSKPTTAQPTTAQVVGNTCSACTTSACVYYRHAYGPNVEEVTIGCASPTLSPSCVAQSGNFGVGASGVYTFGGASTQVNIASSSPTGVGATGKLNIGANTATPTPQEINVGATTHGAITVGGASSTVNIAPAVSSPATVNIATGASTGTVTIGSTSTSAQNINIAPTTSGTIQVGGTESTVGIASGASTGSIYIGAYSPTPTPQFIAIGETSSGTIRLGGGSSSVWIASSGASTGTVTIGTESSASQNINIAPTTTGTITVGGTASTVNIASGASTGTVTIGSSSSSAQNVNIAQTTTGTITVGGSAATIDIGGSSAAAKTMINNSPWNTWGQWFIRPNDQTVASRSLLSFSSASSVPTATPSTISPDANSNAPTSLSSGNAIILGNCRAFVTNNGATYFPAPAPTTVAWGCSTTTTQVASTPAQQPVGFSGDCVYVQRAGLYQISLNVQGRITPTPSTSAITNGGLCMVYSPVAQPTTLAADGIGFPMTKDNTPTASPTPTVLDYRGSFTINYRCPAAPCLISTYMATDPASSTLHTGWATTLSVLNLRNN